MKMIWAALITIIFVSAPNLARATTNAGDFGNGAASNASFGTSGSNGGVTIGSGYANTYNAPTNGLIVQGTVGIGTSSPIDTVDIGTSGVWPLYLSSSSTDSTLTESYNSSASVGYYYGTTGTSNPLGSPSGAFVIGKVGTGTYFTITSSGNVGVYTVSPIVALDLSQKTDAIAIPVGTSGSRPTGGNLTNGEIRYNTSTLEVEAYINNAWMPLGGGGIGSVAGIAGHLQCGGSNCSNSTGSTTLNYCPYKGNIKTTASQGNYTIPSGCLSATTTSMYVGGVGSTSLSANTLYYIYLWNNSGTWVLDAETTGKFIPVRHLDWNRNGGGVLAFGSGRWTRR